MALMLENSSCGGGGGAGDQGLLLSLDSHKAVPAPFLTKTYQLVDDPSTDHVVSWGEDDSTFVVWRPPEFARDLLPNYFKHNNFSSFVRQLNTYGFRKIVPDRWEFANDFFKKGEKHLLCEIHRRKTAHPPPPPPPHHHHHHLMGPGAGFFPFSTNRISISPDDDDLHLFPNHHNHNHNYWDNPPPAPQRCSPPRTTATTAAAGGSSNSGVGTVTALAQDNERLRRSNNMLMSELAHMKKLYNDIIYFVQNHVKPVAPPTRTTHHSTSSSFPPFPSNGAVSSHHHLAQKPLNQLLGYYPASNMQGGAAPQLIQVLNNSNNVTTTNGSTTSPSYSNSGNSQSTVTILEELPNPDNKGGIENDGSCSRTKLFGVPISKKRVHPDQYYGGATVENSKAHRLVLGKDDLGLNLMPPSAC